MNRNTGMHAGQIIGTVGGQQVVGLDIAKLVFQLHTVDMQTGEIVYVQLKRAKVLEHFANKLPCLIGIEACGGARHWAREFIALGHTVRLIHAKVVRPLVAGNKTDATDARAIWLALQQPSMRTMQTNALRGLLYEFGAIFAKGNKALFKDIETQLEALALPQMVADSLREQVARIKSLG
jgi:transposase